MCLPILHCTASINLQTQCKSQRSQANLATTTLSKANLATTALSKANNTFKMTQAGTKEFMADYYKHIEQNAVTERQNKQIEQLLKKETRRQGLWGFLRSWGGYCLPLLLLMYQHKIGAYLTGAFLVGKLNQINTRASTMFVKSQEIIDQACYDKMTTPTVIQLRKAMSHMTALGKNYTDGLPRFEVTDWGR